MSYVVQHLGKDETFHRPLVFHNPYLSGRDKHRVSEEASAFSSSYASTIRCFHSTLPSYAATKLHCLPGLAAELGVSHVFVKDEGTRFDLPAFKILGSSWAIHCTLCTRLDLDPASTPYSDVGSILLQQEEKIELVLCTEGNWGRACARYASLLGISAVIYVPGFMSEHTQALIKGEGAELRLLKDSSYDDTITTARSYAASHPTAILMLDVSFDDYTTIPEWVTAGYTTMLTETAEQIETQFPGLRANTFFASVGVGSWAQAVVAFYQNETKSAASRNRIVTVEPTKAASLKESLHVDALTPIRTGETIMAGMCCGTTSQNSWPVLRSGVDTAVAVTDVEAHREVEWLLRHGIKAGPCGAATLAGLRRYLNAVEPEHLSDDEKRSLVVVLFSTEGAREYEIPESDTH